MSNVWDKVQQYLKEQEQKIVKNQGSENAKSYNLVSDPEKIQEIANLSYEDFVREKIAIRFLRNVFGEDVWLVSNESALELVDGDGVVFFPDEIRELKKLVGNGLEIEDLKQICLAKKFLGGRLIH